jgi:hypothetical protein
MTGTPGVGDYGAIALPAPALRLVGTGYAKALRFFLAMAALCDLAPAHPFPILKQIFLGYEGNMLDGVVAVLGGPAPALTVAAGKATHAPKERDREDALAREI